MSNIVRCNILEVIEEAIVPDIVIGGITISTVDSPDLANRIDLDNANPGNNLLEYDQTVNAVILESNGSDMYLVNKSSGSHNLVVKNDVGPVIIQSGSNLIVQDTANNDILQINSAGTTLTTDIASLIIGGSSGTTNQVLTANGGGHCSWQTIGGGGSGTSIVENETNNTFYPTFTNTLTGTVPSINTSNSLTYNPSTHTLDNNTTGTIINQTYTTPYAIDMSITSVASSITINSANSLAIGNSAGFGAFGQVLMANGTGQCSWQNSPPIIGVPPAICFVSSISGNDANPGTIYQPVATINQALTLCSANIPAPGCVIYCFDTSSFVESVTLNGGVTIYAPFANIDSPGGDTIKTAANNTGNIINFYSVQNSSGTGAPINNTIGYFTCNLIVIYPGNGNPVVNSSGNPMTLTAEGTYVNITNTGGGSKTICNIAENVGGSLDINCFSNWSNLLTPAT